MSVPQIGHGHMNVHSLNTGGRCKHKDVIIQSEQMDVGELFRHGCNNKLQFRNIPKDGTIGPCYCVQKVWHESLRAKSDRMRSGTRTSSCSLYIYFKATSFVKYKYKLWDILITKLKQKWTHQNYFTAVASQLCTSSVLRGEYQHYLKTLLYKQFCSPAC